MQEYEHSFKVKNIEPFIDYCKKNGYTEISISIQNRKVFENKHNPKLISRLTINEINNKSQINLDFKLSGKEIDGKKLSKESESLILSKEDVNVVMSMLDILDFKLVADNFRTRYVYEKNNIIFEIDDYTVPNMKVVAVEGDELYVEALCTKDLQPLLKQYNIETI